MKTVTVTNINTLKYLCTLLGLYLYYEEMSGEKDIAYTAHLDTYLKTLTVISTEDESAKANAIYTALLQLEEAQYITINDIYLDYNDEYQQIFKGANVTLLLQDVKDEEDEEDEEVEESAM